ALDPVAKILAWFDLLEERTNCPEDRGCIFFNAAIDFPNDRESIRAAIDLNNDTSHRLLVDLAREAGLRQPEQLAEELGIIRRGAQITATSTRTPDSIRYAKRAAERAIQAHGGLSKKTSSKK
ncbi:MAG: hypothetical protein AAGL98_13415, partial [Planctomycetota bacterium]